MVTSLYHFFTKTATTKYSINFERVGQLIDDDHQVLVAVNATSGSIDLAMKKFKLTPTEAVRSKLVTEFLQAELNMR